MTHFTSASGTDASRIAAQLAEGGPADGVQLVTVFASPAHSLSDAVAALEQRFPNATVIGSSSAGEFTEGGDAKQSIAACAVGGAIRVSAGFGEGLAADPEKAVASALEQRLPADDEYPHETAILLLDALTGRGEEASLLAAEYLGPGVPLAGGAAGDDLAMKRGVVAGAGRSGADSVVVATLRSKQRLGLGVRHGHRALSDVFEVTKADGNVVHELDGKRAFDVWVSATEHAAGRAGLRPRELSEQELTSFLLRYEAGIAAGSTYKVRAPLSKNADGSINFACGVPTGTKLQIMESTAGAQVDSARAAAEQARSQLGDRPVAGAIVFDCICRNLILGDRFAEAVRGVSAALGDAPLAGFETYGEIAMAAGDWSGFHNTTTVVLAFPEQG